MKLLNVDRNGKTVKGQSKGYLTGILYLAPYTLGGRENVCPNATLGCKKACLYTAGRGSFSNVQKSRINKTQFFFDHQEEFINQLIGEISKLKKKGRKLDLIPVIRLNGTSDIDWENIRFDYSLGKARINPDGRYNIFSLFPHTQFYDYTKSFRRVNGNRTPNYHLTFSHSESVSKSFLRSLLSVDINVSIIFKNGLPDTWEGFKVINGDENDLRFLDGNGVVVGLSPKGKAKKDNSGFVIG